MKNNDGADDNKNADDGRVAFSLRVPALGAVSTSEP